MIKKSHRLVSGIVTAALIAGTLAASLSARASTRIALGAATAQAGTRIVIGDKGPFMRLAVQVELATGSIQTKEIFVSTDSLLKFAMSAEKDFENAPSRTVTIGAIEAHAKQGHFGIGFKGVQLGRDADRGYEELMRTGVYALINLLRSRGGTRLDLRGGYDYDRFTTVDGVSGTRELIDTALALHFNAREVIGDYGSVEGNVVVHGGVDKSDPSNEDLMVFGASANAGVRVDRIAKDIEWGVFAQVMTERDGYREQLGLGKWNTVVSVMLDISHVYRDRRR